MDNRPQAGFVLATLIFFLTALTVLIAVTVPIYKMQAKRTQEEELIYRGEEYIRAIQKFQRKFGAWPPSVDALVETNGLRFLRKPYKDPITGKSFRLITLNADGTVNGSVLFKANNPFAPNNPFSPAAPGQNQQPGQQQPFSGSPTPGQTQSPGSNQNPGSAFSQAGFQSQSLQQQQPFQPPSQAQNGMQQTQPQQSPGQASQNSPFGAQNQTGNGSGTPIGIGIIGVASDSNQEAVKVYNGHQKYNEWEFIAVMNQNGQQNGGTFRVGGGVSTNPNNPFGQPNQSTQPGQTNPFGQPNTTSGFGTTPTTPQPRPPGQ